LAVHTVARVGSAAHGGQIVVSGQTKAAVKPPAGVGFRSLGRHRLPGLNQAVALYQLDADGLLTEFPPLRTG
jgi:class 3 adenylate cyclase